MSPDLENKNSISRLRRRDVAVGAILLVAAWQLGCVTARAYRQTGSIARQPGFDLQFFSVALMQACGRGNVVLIAGERANPKTPREVDRFLDGRREEIGCDDIQGAASAPLNRMLESSRYLTALISTVWRVGQPSWGAIDALMGALFAMTMVMLYAASRLAMGWGWSAAVAAVIALSPLHLSGLVNLRDYSKAPFFAITVLACGLFATKHLSLAAMLTAASVTGFLLGVGFGMRPDCVVYLPLVVITIVFFTPGQLTNSWKIRVAGAIACGIAFVAVAGPIVAAHAGGNTWHWAILGLSHEFDAQLGIGEAPYRLGYFYLDSAVVTIVNAFAGRVTSAAAGATLDRMSFETLSGDYVMALARTFPADMLVRGWAAVLKVTNLPFADAAHHASMGVLPIQHFPPVGLAVLELRDRLVGLFNGPGFVLMPVTIACVASVDWRLAMFMFAAFCYLSGYSALQFHPRHTFHLEFLSLFLLVFSLAQLVSRFGRGREPVPRIAWKHHLSTIVLSLVLMAGVVTVPVAGARLYQRRTTERLLRAYQEAPRDPLPLDPREISGGRIRLGSSSLAAPQGTPTAPTHAAMVLLQASSRCNADALDVAFTYDFVNSSFDFSRTLIVRTPSQSDAPVDVFMPVYYAGGDLSDPGAFRFAGVDIPSAQSSCIQGLYRLREPSRHALLLESVLPTNWRDLSLYQSIELLERPRIYEGGPRTYWSPAELSTRRSAIFERAASERPGIRIPTDFVAPIARIGNDSTVDASGRAADTGSYLLAWKSYPMSRATVIAVDGRLDQGGLTIGLTDPTGWTSRVDIDTPGSFRAFVQPARDGAYQLVVANHLTKGTLRNAFSLTRLTLIENAGE